MYTTEGGAAGSKIYATVEQYLDDKYPDYSLILEIVGYKFINGARGLTILVPDKSLLSDLKKLCDEDSKTISKYSNETSYLKKEYSVPEDQMGHSLARWFVQALTLSQGYPDGESFKIDEIVNKLNKKYKFVSGKGNKAEISIGEVVKDEDFVQLANTGPSKNRDIAYVWIFKGEKPDINTEVFASKRRDFDKPKHGGGLGDQTSAKCITCHIWYKVQQCKEAKRDIELVYLVSLLRFVKKADIEHYKQLLSVISWDPLISLYLILQPGHDEALVKSELLLRWVKTPYFNIESNSKEKYVEICEEGSNSDLQLDAEIKQAKSSLGDYSAFSVNNVYGQMLKKFPIYKSVQHKVNHDVLRYSYEVVETPVDYKRMQERMFKIDSQFGQHSLNPQAVSVSSDDLKEFVNSYCFLHHIRFENLRAGLDKVVSPMFGPAISQEELLLNAKEKGIIA